MKHEKQKYQKHNNIYSIVNTPVLYRHVLHAVGLGLVVARNQMKYQCNYVSTAKKHKKTFNYRLMQHRYKNKYT